MTLLINSTHLSSLGVVLFARRTGDVIVKIMMLRSINFIYLFVTNRVRSLLKPIDVILYMVTFDVLHIRRETHLAWNYAE